MFKMDATVWFAQILSATVWFAQILSAIELFGMGNLMSFIILFYQIHMVHTYSFKFTHPHQRRTVAIISSCMHMHVLQIVPDDTSLEPALALPLELEMCFPEGCLSEHMSHTPIPPGTANHQHEQCTPYHH